MRIDDAFNLMMYQLNCIRDTNEKLLERVTVLEGVVYNSPCYMGPPPRSRSAIL
jgi:hypothetical protein